MFIPSYSLHVLLKPSNPKDQCINKNIYFSFTLLTAKINRKKNVEYLVSSLPTLLLSQSFGGYSTSNVLPIQRNKRAPMTGWVEYADLWWNISQRFWLHVSEYEKEKVDVQ